MKNGKLAFVWEVGDVLLTGLSVGGTWHRNKVFLMSLPQLSRTYSKLPQSFLKAEFCYQRMVCTHQTIERLMLLSTNGALMHYK